MVRAYQLLGERGQAAAASTTSARDSLPHWRPARAVCCSGRARSGSSSTRPGCDRATARHPRQRGPACGRDRLAPDDTDRDTLTDLLDYWRRTSRTRHAHDCSDRGDERGDSSTSRSASAPCRCRSVLVAARSRSRRRHSSSTSSSCSASPDLSRPGDRARRRTDPGIILYPAAVLLVLVSSRTARHRRRGRGRFSRSATGMATIADADDRRRRCRGTAKDRSRARGVRRVGGAAAACSPAGGAGRASPATVSVVTDRRAGSRRHRGGGGRDHTGQAG